MFWSTIFLLPFFLHSFSPIVVAGQTPDFPIVDLGYAKHSVTAQWTGPGGVKFGEYLNIRFAKPPLEDYRFRKPVTPPPNETEVQDGHRLQLPVCISSKYHNATVPYKGYGWGQEDCLFLDVMVPEGTKPGDNLPVVHGFPGGHFIYGSKNAREVAANGLFFKGPQFDQRVIFVSSNYRLGIFGFLSSSVETSDANIGIYDCMAALEWTKQHISLFGGDPNRITVYGQEAGAGIIATMLASYGGMNGTLPFSKAILISPNLMPYRNSKYYRELLYDTVLTSGKCVNIGCLRLVSETELMDLNRLSVQDDSNMSGGGMFGPGLGFGPVVDGSYLPDAAQILISQGHFHQEVEAVIVSSTYNEGQGIAQEYGLPERFLEIVKTLLPSATNITVGKIRDIFQVSPTDPPEKLVRDWVKYMLVTCNSVWIGRAYAAIGGGRGTARKYLFNVDPGTPGSDLPYLSYINHTVTPLDDPVTADRMQGYMLNFIAGAGAELRPPPGSPDWPLYGKEADMLRVKLGALEITRDMDDFNGICDTLMDTVIFPNSTSVALDPGVALFGNVRSE
ncbi:hypothetical protein AJ78_05929 [Emergomyces pasteurianus Ep9510]|uniref:Carboxylesterase type B domain-containing protein n=1 Tax=Emergomyces pasteurianus Ep9510 TaxID=1447872 RepID=A0A1J9PAP0_9EURO|nr:hypothetical protein AJ78_05929 [Emergomyces pasteurianus Ep9510]